MNARDSKTSTLGAAILGAVVGAGAVILSDPKKRDQVKRKVNELLDEGSHKLSEAEEKLNTVKTKGKKMLADKMSNVEQKLRKDETDLETDI